MWSVVFFVKGPEVGVDSELGTIGGNMDDIHVESWEPILQQGTPYPQWVHHGCCYDFCVAGVHVVQCTFDDRAKFNHDCVLGLLGLIKSICLLICLFEK